MSYRTCLLTAPGPAYPVCALLVLSGFLLTACSSPAPTASPENLVAAGCEALVAGDLDAWREYTITAADFILKDEGMLSPFKQKMSYAGTQLKPEEIAGQDAEFRRAAGEFRDGSCDGVQLHGSETRERMDGGMLDVRLYAAVVDGKPRQSPLFEVVGWSNERYRLLGLTFADEFARSLPDDAGIADTAAAWDTQYLPDSARVQDDGQAGE